MLEYSDSSLLLNEQWLFCKIPSDAQFSFKYQNIKSLREWMPVQIPHDWDKDGPWLQSHKSGTSGGYAPCGRGVYKRITKIPNFDSALRYFLYFDGIYMNSSIYINGILAYQQYYGYAPFWFEITGVLQGKDEFEIAVMVDHSKQPSCRWYSGSGIYRNVYLISMPELSFTLGSLFITSVFEDCDFKEQKIQFKIESGSNVRLKSDSKSSVECIILDSNGNIISNTEMMFSGVSLLGDHEIRISVKDPELWAPNHPSLYRLELTLKNQELGVICKASRRFGIRHIEFSERGFSLNGEIIKLKGVNLHHDGGCVGSAVPKEIWERRILKLKEMGCNAIRTSHNPPSAEFLDLCDSMGMLVLAEAFDKKDAIWQQPIKMRLNRAFRTKWLKNLENFIFRDRNHPSIILWSLGNEIGMMHTSKMKKFFVYLKEFAKSLDNTRPITVVLMPDSAIKELKYRKKPYYEDIVDVICTNYTEAYLPEFHKIQKNKAMISAEAYHYWRRRGPNESFDLFPPKEGHPAYTAHNPWMFVKNVDYICGIFLWTGIEYLGEVRDPYPYHGRTNAPIRITGYLKPQAFWFQSQWREDPIVRIVVLDEKADLPRGKIHFEFPKVVRHWSFHGRENEILSVYTYTNCDKVKLRINGQNIGEKQADKFNNETEWKVPYSPGTIEAIGIIGEKEMAFDSLKTVIKTHRLLLKPDRTELKADGFSCLNTEIMAVDGEGNLNMHENALIEISTEGPIQLIALDNGDLSDHTPYSSNATHLFNGTAIAIFRAKKEGGSALIKMKSQFGVEEEKIILTSETNRI